MKTFKEMKKGAKQTLKKHYLLAVFLVLIITFLGATKPVSRIMTESLIEPFKPNNSQSFSLLLQQTNGSPSTAVLDDMVAGNFEAGQEIADAYKEARMTGVAENGFGGNRGIASEVLATFGSGAVMLNLAKAVSGLLGSNSTGAAVVLIGSVLVSLLVFIFIQNILEPLVARMLMEARTYKNVPLTHIFHPFAVGRWFRMAMVMLVKSIFLGLWSLTIIGGIIKFFSYAMVPYITAENPNVKPLEAITLSRRMMKGHKWKLFLFYLSYIGWFLLGILTFGLLNYFFVDPYIRLGGVEFYEEVRRQAIENKIQGYELLNDEYLHEIPKHRVLNDNYLDTAYEAKDLEGRDLKLKGVQGFLAKAFGIWIGSTQKQREYQDYIIEKKGLEEDTDAMNGLTYPNRLNPLYTPVAKRVNRRLNWTRVYSVWSLITMFILFSFIGWVWEVSLIMVEYHVFANRGALHGPWLPIYGIGGILIVIVLSYLKKNPVAEFVTAIALAGSVEYSIAKYLEDVNHIRYWNYKGNFLHLDGRICFEGLLVFGIMGMVIVYLIAPMIDDILTLIPARILMVVALVLFGCYMGDNFYSSANPNVGSGVSEDLAIGGWPTTLGFEDKLDMPAEEETEIRENIADVQTLQTVGIYINNIALLDEAREDGIVDAIEEGRFDEISDSEEVMELRTQIASGVVAEE